MKPKQSSRPANPDEERIAGIKKRYKFAEDYWQKQFENMAEDIKHLNPDTQFPDGTREARMGKPTVAVDRLNQSIHSIVNSQRHSGSNPPYRNILQGKPSVRRRNATNDPGRNRLVAYRDRAG